MTRELLNKHQAAGQIQRVVRWRRFLQARAQATLLLQRFWRRRRRRIAATRLQRWFRRQRERPQSQEPQRQAPKARPKFQKLELLSRQLPRSQVQRPKRKPTQPVAPRFHTDERTMSRLLDRESRESLTQGEVEQLEQLEAKGLLSKQPRAASVLGPALDTEAVAALWAKSSSREVRSIRRVEGLGAVAAAYEGVAAALGPERLLWHGTSWDSAANIIRHGFNRAYSGRHGSRLGRGSYFTEDPSYALRFCGRGNKAVFLAGVLPGRFCKGAEGLVEPPPDDSGVRFDSTVDDPQNPRAFCVFRDFQALPLFLLEI